MPVTQLVTVIRLALLTAVLVIIPVTGKHPVPVSQRQTPTHNVLVMQSVIVSPASVTGRITALYSVIVTSLVMVMRLANASVIFIQIFVPKVILVHATL